MAKSKGDTSLEQITLDIQLGRLPKKTVDAMFAGLTAEALDHPSMSARAAVAARFAASLEETDIMSDPEVEPRHRLQAAKQFSQGFMDLCRLMMERPPEPKIVRQGGVIEGEDIDAALDKAYGKGK